MEQCSNKLTKAEKFLLSPLCKLMVVFVIIAVVANIFASPGLKASSSLGIFLILAPIVIVTYRKAHAKAAAIKTEKA